MADVGSSSNMNGHASDAYEAPATPTTKKRGRKPRPEEPKKKSRLQANDKDIVNPDPETETDEQRDEVKRNIGQANLSYDHGVFVIRPMPNANSRQTWPWYCLNFQSIQEYQDWLGPRGEFFCAICRHPTLGAAVSTILTQPTIFGPQSKATNPSSNNYDRLPNTSTWNVEA